MTHSLMIPNCECDFDRQTDIDYNIRQVEDEVVEVGYCYLIVELKDCVVEDDDMYEIWKGLPLLVAKHMPYHHCNRPCRR